MTLDFPTTPASWLTPDEQFLAQKRIADDTYNCEQKRAPLSGLGDALTDWTLWWLAAAGCFLLVGSSFGLFFPTIAATMGYSPEVTLLLCAGLLASQHRSSSCGPSCLATFYIHLTSVTDIPTLPGIVSGILLVLFQWVL